MISKQAKIAFRMLKFFETILNKKIIYPGIDEDRFFILSWIGNSQIWTWHLSGNFEVVHASHHNKFFREMNPNHCS